VLEVLALALWIPLGVAGVWFLATGRMILGLPKGLKEGWQLRVFGLAYVLMAGYLTYRAIHDGSFSADGLVAGYVPLVALVLVAIYRRQKARTKQATAPRP
jgi:uncharacterized membrane-anchored protein